MNNAPTLSSLVPDLAFSERDLDTHFIGQWDVHNVDDYGSVKAGTESRNAVVRSHVDMSEGTITFNSRLKSRYNVANIVMDGTVGIYGKITERAPNKDDKLTRVDFLFMHLLEKEKIKNPIGQTASGLTVWEGVVELDDIVFNSPEYKVYYYGSGKVPILVGMAITMPISEYNHYVHMRDLWFRDYHGSREIHPFPIDH